MNESNDAHTKILHALATVEGAYQEAISRRKSIKGIAQAQYDVWGKKASDPHDPDFKHHLLERRTAALLMGDK